MQRLAFLFATILLCFLIQCDAQRCGPGCGSDAGCPIGHSCQCVDGTLSKRDLEPALDNDADQLHSRQICIGTQSLQCAPSASCPTPAPITTTPPPTTATTTRTPGTTAPTTTAPTTQSPTTIASTTQSPTTAATTTTQPTTSVTTSQAASSSSSATTVSNSGSATTTITAAVTTEMSTTSSQSSSIPRNDVETNNQFDETTGTAAIGTIVGATVGVLICLIIAALVVIALILVNRRRKNRSTNDLTTITTSNGQTVYANTSEVFASRSSTLSSAVHTPQAHYANVNQPTNQPPPSNAIYANSNSVMAQSPNTYANVSLVQQ